ncbi:MAG TPA: hypothetical protein VD905_08585 [Flavobacteriales bacterium]|nr:hypothetical protein [Flavobacteriales bacterium]
MIKKAAILVFVICVLSSCGSKSANSNGDDKDKKGSELFSPFQLF